MDLCDSVARLKSARRILVLGSGGSGKTTLCIRLGQLMDIETIHLDAHFWKPGWIATPQVEWRQIVQKLINRPSWIMDGTYESTLDLRISKADALVLVNIPRWRCVWRVVKRKLTIADGRRPDAPPGQKLDRAFLRYIWRYPSVTHPVVLKCIERGGSDRVVIPLNGSRAVRRFLQLLEQATGALSVSQ